MVLSESTGSKTVRYWHSLDTLAQSDGTSVEYFAYDGLGSVRQLVDASGALQLAQTFDPYGNGYSKAGSTQSTLGYTGEQVDANGFVYLRARYYNPALGRFFQMDPSRQEKNGYLYCAGNPVMYTDPSGFYRLGVSGPDWTWGTLEHIAVENWYMERYKSPSYLHVEYTIPNTGRRRIDILNSRNGEIFEIKPVTLAAMAFSEVVAYFLLMVEQKINGNLHGVLHPMDRGAPAAVPYDWNLWPPLFWPGDDFPSRQLIAVRGDLALYATLVAPGSIVYWYEPRPEYVLATVAEIVGATKIYKDWIKGRGFMPPKLAGATAFSTSPQVATAGGVVLIIAGGGLIVLTIGEDICTGVGILDDPATIAAAILLIKQGAQVVPAY